MKKRVGIYLYLIPLLLCGMENSQSQPDSSDVPQGVVEQFGSLIVQSLPMGSEVNVDGIIIGSTPVVLQNIPMGRHILSLSLEGYADTTIYLSTQSDILNQVNVHMKSNFARLFLSTDLTYSKIYLDDEFLGESRAGDKRISQGSYTLQVKADHYHTYSEKLTLISGDTLRRQIVMNPMMGVLNLTSNPFQKSLVISPNELFHKFYVDDEQYEALETTIDSSYQRPFQAGLYTLSLASPGFYPLEKSIFVESDRTLNLNIDLRDGKKDYQQLRAARMRNVKISILAAASGILLDYVAQNIYEEYLIASTVKEANTLHYRTQIVSGMSDLSLSLSIGCGGLAVHKHINLHRLGELIHIDKVIR